MLEEDLNLKEQEDCQFIVFNLDRQEYTVPIMTVQEIIMLQDIKKMPKLPNFIEGITKIREQIIPVVDGRKRFGLAPAEKTDETRIIILNITDHIIGLIVDSVSEVITANSKNIVPSPISLKDENDFLKGVCKLDNKLLLMLDVDKFFDTHEVESVKNLLSSTKK